MDYVPSGRTDDGGSSEQEPVGTARVEMLTLSAVLGIDLGLSSARAAVVTRDGRLVGRGRAVQPALTGGDRQTGRVVADWTASVTTAVREALSQAAGMGIEAIGIGALGPCPILLDERQQALNAAPLFSLDDGAETERLALLTRHGIAPHRLGPDHVIPRLRLWQRERPAEMARARVVVDATGCLVAWLTGHVVMDPITHTDHSCEGLEQPVPLPEIEPAAAIAGGLTAHAARVLGLPVGTPVTIGTYDSFADLVGAGVDAPGRAGVLLGSTAVLGAIAAASPDEANAAAAGLRLSPHVGEGVFVGGWTSASGSLIDWSREVTGGANGSASGPTLPGEAGLLALPYGAGERAPVWDVMARGALVGLTLSTTRSDIHGAMVEAVALSLLDLADRLEGLVGRIETCRVAGGGLNNPAWAQATADALGVPLEATEHAGEAMGPVALAFRATAIDRGPRIAHLIRPDPRRHERYRELLVHYRRLYPALRDTMHALGRMQSRRRERT